MMADLLAKYSASILAVQEVISKKPPGMLYHYTSRNGLLGMVKDGAIWASSLRHVNDSRELETAFDIFKAVRKRIEQKADPTTRAFLDRIEFGDSIDTYVQSASEDWGVFAFSLSSSSDELAMWRAYGRAGDAYAVGFRTNELERLRAPAGSFSLVKCIYEKDQRSDVVERLLVQSIEAAKQEMSLTGNENTARLTFGAIFDWGFRILLPALKHQGFHSEEEWRLAVCDINLAYEGVEYRDGGRLLLPYMKLRPEPESKFTYWSHCDRTHASSCSRGENRSGAARSL